MKLLLLGASGNIGSRILGELVRRGHQVTALYRRLPGQGSKQERVEIVVMDVTDPAAIAQVIPRHDAVISAIGPGSLGDPVVIERTATALVQAMPASGVSRLLVVGGAGTLEIEPGVMRLDRPDYPEQYRAQGLAQKKALAAYKASGLDWTYVSPPIIIRPGDRTGRYRIGGDQVLFDGKGVSYISIEDYAVAITDIVEGPLHCRQRITVGY
jgi:putative NADH-flavin reductase